MKIETVELKEVVFSDDDGEFKKVYTNRQQVPCFITNYAFKKGKETGLLEGSLVANLFKMEKVNSKKQEEKEQAMENIDHIEMAKLIYIGCMGANKKIGLSFDEFLDKFHYTMEETMELYGMLVESLMTQNPNNFAKGLQQSTKKQKK